jgi:hypothetical protein
LLSYEYRKRNHLLFADENPKGIVACEFGLYKYVFAFLCSHEPYYAENYAEPAFGVFISKEIEKDDTVNASRRDMATLEININEERALTDEEIKRIRAEFLMPEDARKLIACEINKNYDKSIWEYWDAPWDKKAEMHFFDKVRIEDIKGIIWPVKKLNMKGGRTDMSYYYDQFMDFAKECPHIKIYQYDWTSKYGHKAFKNASRYVSEFFYNHGKYPENCKIKYEP